MSEMIKEQSINQARGAALQGINSQEDYRAEADAQTLIAAEEIKQDKERFDRARSWLREKTTAIVAAAKAVGAIDGIS